MRDPGANADRRMGIDRRTRKVELRGLLRPLGHERNEEDGYLAFEA